jgi:hypothetical protein
MVLLSSFGPLSNAIDMAPLTHITVPTIFAILLKLPILIFSNLFNYKKKKKQRINYTLILKYEVQELEI